MNDNSPMLSILIVNWNTRELLRACLLSLRAHLENTPHEIIVVDNASSDGSAEMVAREFAEVILIANADNCGFAEGNNQAFARSCGEWIWLLNPDTEILPDAAHHLIEWLRDNDKRGAAASALIDARDGHIQRSCRTFPTPAALWCEASGLASRFARSKRFGFYRMGWWNYRETRRVAQPMASSLMLRRAAVESAGGLFDAAFPIFFNDVDLCWRLLNCGQEIWFVPISRVRHWGGAATRQVRPAMIAESHRALKHFYAKHYRARLSPLIYGATWLLIDWSGRFRVWRASRRFQSSGHE